MQSLGDRHEECHGVPTSTPCRASSRAGSTERHSLIHARLVSTHTAERSWKHGRFSMTPDGYPTRSRPPITHEEAPMKKSLIAAAALAALGAIGIAAPASAAPGMIGAVDATTNIVDVRMDDMHGHRGHHMRHHHHRGHMMRHHHHRGHMMRHGHGHRHHRM